ncbi:MAG: DUF2867 domain-containing protein [Pseudomonadales bacterium]
MTFNVEKSPIPKASTISKELSDSYFFDSYSFHTKQHTRKALQIWLDHASKTPRWVNFLMACRNKIVSSMGLKNIGHLGDFDIKKPIDEYRVGDSVGIFTLLFLSDNEIILSDSDKHLDVKVSVYKESSESRVISISTVVHVHNSLGKLYMVFVKPMHKLIVPSSIIRAESIEA